MNKSDHKIREELKTRMLDAFLNTLLDSDNLKQAKPILEFTDMCKKENIDSNHIIEAVDKSDEIKELIDVAKVSVTDRDDLFLTITKKIASKISTKLISYISDLTGSNINTVIENDERGIQANTHLFSKTIHPYIRIVLVSSPSPVGKKELLRIDFQIEVTGEISNLIVNKDKKQISGKLQYIINGSVVKFGTILGSISTNIELAEKEFGIELVNFVW